jgi:hypothetical protein
MGHATFKRMLQEAIAREGISHRELGKLTDPDDPERGRRRVQRHLRGTEPTAASRIAYAKALDAPELAPDCVEGHRLVALVEEQPVPGPGCSSANTSEPDTESTGADPEARPGSSVALCTRASSPAFPAAQGASVCTTGAPAPFVRQLSPDDFPALLADGRWA